MDVRAGPAVLSLLVSPTEAYFFDRAGRFFAAWHQGCFVSLGLSGRATARRWQDQTRDIRALKSQEIAQLDALARRALQDAYALAPESDRLWIGRACTFDRAQDVSRFQHIYRPIGILPPDHYNTCVVQVTEGCPWNRCRFCSFYRGQPSRSKERGEILAHIRHIGDYLGDSLSLRRSIFLGAANAMAASLDLLHFAMETAQKLLVPRMPDFRGFYSFSDGAEHSRSSHAEFRTLVRLGLRRIYIGLETGHAELRETLRKPGTLDRIRGTVDEAKAAGMKVGLILLAGLGGERWAERHVRASVRYLRRLPLDTADIVFLSPLYGADGTGAAPMQPAAKARQVGRFRRALEGWVRTAPYDIREFVY